MPDRNIRARQVSPSFIERILDFQTNDWIWIEPGKFKNPGQDSIFADWRVVFLNFKFNLTWIIGFWISETRCCSSRFLSPND
jgi:hypothetical protein